MKISKKKLATMNQKFWKSISFKRRIRYMGIFIILFLVIGFSASYAFMSKTVDVAPVTVKVGSLEYTLECDKLTNNQITLSANSSEILDLKLTSLNSIDSRYEIYYTVVSPTELTNEIDGGHYLPEESAAIGTISKQEEKSFSIVLNNTGSQTVTLEIGIKAGLINNEVELAENEKTLNDEGFQKFFVFGYSTSVQTFEAQVDGTYEIEIYGAASASGQAGAKVVGDLELVKGDFLYLLTGGKGSGTTGGFNGGGTGANAGGGATQVTTTNRGQLTAFASYSSEVVAVAAGAGGNGGSPTVSSNVYGASFSWTDTTGSGGASGNNGGTAKNVGFSNNGYKQSVGANGGKATGAGGAAVSGSQTWITGYGSSCASGRGGGGGAGWPGGGGGSSGSIFGTNGSSSGTSVGKTGNAGGSGSNGKGGTGGTAISSSANGKSSPLTPAGGGGGAGGTSYYTPLTNAVLTNGANTGNGYAKIILLHANPNVYTVQYNANGGSGTMKDSRFSVGTTSSLKENTFTKEGASFLGWATSEDGEVVYNDREEVTNLTGKGETITLYAVWQNLSSYTVILKANGGSGDDVTKVCYRTQGCTLKADNFVREGFLLSGWSQDSGATNITYSNGQVIDNMDVEDGASVTLYAIWTANTYTITYNANGGSGAPSNQVKTHGVDLTLSNTVPTRSGYTFLGWNTSSTATTASYTAGGTYSGNTNLTLYAVWKKNAQQVALTFQYYTHTYSPSAGNHSKSLTSSGSGTGMTYTLTCDSGGADRGWGSYSYTAKSTSTIDVSEYKKVTVQFANLSSGNASISQIVKAQLIDSSGTVIKEASSTASSGTLTIDTSSVTGSYYLTYYVYYEANWNYDQKIVASAKFYMPTLTND